MRQTWMMKIVNVMKNGNEKAEQYENKWSTWQSNKSGNWRRLKAVRYMSLKYHCLRYTKCWLRRANEIRIDPALRHGWWNVLKKVLCRRLCHFCVTWLPDASEIFLLPVCGSWLYRLRIWHYGTSWQWNVLSLKTIDQRDVQICSKISITVSTECMRHLKILKIPSY